MIDMENWKPVVGYEGLYEVSDQGRVRSYRRCSKYSKERQPKLLAGNKKWTGYIEIQLYDGYGNKKYSPAHRLVAEAFIPNPDGKPEVNHKNGIRDDNRAENLEWVTCSENHKHAFKELHKEHSRSTKGKASKNRKLTYEQAESIRADCRQGTEIAKEYGVSTSIVYNIKHGRFYNVKEGESVRMINDLEVFNCRVCDVKPELIDKKQKYIKCPKCGTRTRSSVNIDTIVTAWNELMGDKKVSA